VLNKTVMKTINNNLGSLRQGQTK